MSAFIVGNVHINAMLQAAETTDVRDIASYWHNGTRHYFDPHSIPTGQALVDENFRSVNHRYGEDMPPSIYVYKPLRRYTVTEILRAISCYEYLCCETDDWEESEAYAIVQALRYRAIRALPGYNAAQWNITE